MPAAQRSFARHEVPNDHTVKRAPRVFPICSPHAAAVNRAHAGEGSSVVH